MPEGAQGERHHGRLEGDDPPPSLPPHPPPPTHQSGGHDADGPGQEGEVVPGVESVPEGAQGERHHGRLEGDPLVADGPQPHGRPHVPVGEEHLQARSGLVAHTAGRGLNTQQADDAHGRQGVKYTAGWTTHTAGRGLNIQQAGRRTRQAGG